MHYLAIFVSDLGNVLDFKVRGVCDLIGRTWSFFFEKGVVPRLLHGAMHTTIFIALFNKDLQNKHIYQPKATFLAKIVVLPTRLMMCP